MNPTRSTYAVAICALSLLFSTSNAQEIPSLTAELRSLLANKQTDAAIKLITSASAQQKAQPDVLLLTGVAYQQLAAQSDNNAKQAALRQAETAYKRALSQPADYAPKGGRGKSDVGAPAPPANGPTQSAAALNNLASLYAGMGEDEQARRYYNQAIASNDSQRGYYALNFARYLESRDAVQAIAMARIATESVPGNATARDFLGQLLWRNRIDDMLPYANQLSKQGFPDAATRWALKCLQSGSRPADEQRTWLVLLARNATLTLRYRALANQADVLDGLQSNEAIGRGAVQLRAVLNAAPQSPQAIDWWTNQTSPIASLGISPRDAMRDLLRAAGEAVLQKDPQTAGHYLRAALDTNSREPDPDVFLRLVELYANSKSVSSLNQLQDLMRNYQQRLFNTKAAAYAQENWPLIYRMHIALGMTYAYLGVWQSTSPYQNAVFQLDAAQKAAAQLNAQAMSQNKPERVVLPPVAVAKLAEGYALTNRQELALKTKVDGAETLQKFGYTRESNDVLDSISTQYIDAASPEVIKQINKLKGVAIQAK